MNCGLWGVYIGLVYAYVPYIEAETLILLHFYPRNVANSTQT